MCRQCHQRVRRCLPDRSGKGRMPESRSYQRGRYRDSGHQQQMPGQEHTGRTRKKQPHWRIQQGSPRTDHPRMRTDQQGTRHKSHQRQKRIQPCKEHRVRPERQRSQMCRVGKDHLGRSPVLQGTLCTHLQGLSSNLPGMARSRQEWWWCHHDQLGMARTNHQNGPWNQADTVCNLHPRWS